MRITPLALTLLLSTPAFAQGPSPQSADNLKEQVAKRVVQIWGQIPAAPSQCPVGFSADRRGSAGLEVTKPGDAHTGMGLDLKFGGRAVIEADVTVHGMPFEARVVPTPLSAPKESAEDFVVKGTAEEPLRLSSVWMKQLGVVRWAELTRVVFADGTTWTPVGSSPCVARPSMVVLVGSSTR